MGRRLQQASFEEWLDFLFDHPVTDPAWYWATEADGWDGSPSETVGHLVRTFRESGTVLGKYSDAQLNEGLWYVASPACSNIAWDMFDESLAWPLRKEAIESIGDLFEHCFDVRCSAHLSHLGETGANPLNAVCYMWWDELPVIGNPEKQANRELDTIVLGVMERILQLKSEACRESALHGLGHWHHAYPEQVERIIDHFIWHDRQIRNPLRNYAYAARHGDVQ